MQKKSTTTFEVIDTNRDWETKAGDDYCHLMIDFIRSLGFDAELQYPDGGGLLDHILIDGVKAFLYTDSASYMGQSAYTKVRKPRVTRFIGISSYGTWSKKGCIIIPINKEIDKNKLIKKISELIKNKSDREKQFLEHKESQENISIKIINHLQSKLDIREAMTSLHIKNGEIFIRTGLGEICFDISTWLFKKFSPCEIPFSTIEEIRNARHVTERISIRVLKYIKIISDLGTCLTESEIELTKSMNHSPNLKQEPCTDLQSTK